MIWIWWACQAGTDTTTPFYFRNRRPKRSHKFEFAFVFSRLDIWIVIYQPSMTLFKLNDFSNQCPQLAWGPEHRVTPSRRNEIYQIDPGWIKPKKRETLSYTDDFFPPFWFLGLFGSLTSQSLLEYVGIFHFQSQKRRMKGFLVSNLQMGSLRNCPGKGVRCHNS